jgi:hypothetical protein
MVAFEQLCRNVATIQQCCSRLALMHPLFRIVLHFVGNTATLFLRCTRNSCVAIKTCYGHHTRVGCVWTALSQCLIWVANIYLRCCNTRKAIASFLGSRRNIVYVLPRNLFWWKNICYGVVAKFKMRFNK